MDILIEESSLTSAQANAALLTLKSIDYIQRQPGNLYVRLW